MLYREVSGKEGSWREALAAPGSPRADDGSFSKRASDTPNKQRAGEEQPWQQSQNWNPIEGQEETWADYCEVNRQFARAVVENYCDGDLIWVQHYHLLLAPSYLARKLRTANIGARAARAHDMPDMPPPCRASLPPRCALTAVPAGGLG